MPHLVLSPRQSDDGARLARAAKARGWTIERLPRWRVDAERAMPVELAIYGEPLFARVVAAQIGRVMLEPPHDWLTHVPRRFSGRSIVFTTLDGIDDLEWPCFLKPPDDKIFPAAVYASADALRTARPDLPGTEPLIASEPVRFTTEYRVHMLDRRAVSCSRYAVDGDLDPSPDDPHISAAAAFAEEVSAAVAEHTPPAVVVDVGRLADDSWAVVEANPCFGAGIYAGAPERILDVLLAACGPLDAPGPKRFRMPVVLEE